jgi:uncharacterized membrane protein YtjA (UPF0391 family)
MYFKAKLRGLVVFLVIMGIAAVFGWGTGTIQAVMTVVFGIGFVFFILSLFNRS